MMKNPNPEQCSTLLTKQILYFFALTHPGQHNSSFLHNEETDDIYSGDHKWFLLRTFESNWMVRVFMVRIKLSHLKKKTKTHTKWFKILPGKHNKSTTKYTESLEFYFISLAWRQKPQISFYFKKYTRCNFIYGLWLQTSK